MWFSFHACCSCRYNGEGGFSFDIRQSYYICSTMFVCNPSIFLYDLLEAWVQCLSSSTQVVPLFWSLFCGGTRFFWHKKYHLWKRKTRETCKKKKKKKSLQMLHLVLWQTCSEGTISRLFLCWNFLKSYLSCCLNIVCSEKWVIFTADMFDDFYIHVESNAKIYFLILI